MGRSFFIQFVSFFTPYNRISECGMDMSNYTLNQVISTHKRCAQGIKKIKNKKQSKQKTQPQKTQPSKQKKNPNPKEQEEKKQSRRWELAGQKKHIHCMWETTKIQQQDLLLLKRWLLYIMMVWCTFQILPQVFLTMPYILISSNILPRGRVITTLNQVFIEKLVSFYFI